MADDEATQDFKNLELVQSMIDISAERLEGLRTKCATSAELTQQEIRTLEGKLVKMFSRQLVGKAKLRTDDLKNIPSLTQWLQVVGLSNDSVRAVCQRVASLEELKEKSEHELRSILGDGCVARPEELGRLHRALHNLRRYTEVLLRGDSTQPDMPLYWDSWDRHHHHHHHHNHHQPHLKSNSSPRVGRSRGTRASVPSEECLSTLSATGHVTNGTTNNGLNASLAPSSSVSSISSLVLSPHSGGCSPTPPLTPPVNTKTSKGGGSNNGVSGNSGGGTGGERVKFPTTPPPRKRHLAGVQNNALLPDAYPLTKSKSHESQLAAGRDADDQQAGRRARLPTEPGPASPPSMPAVSASSPVRSPPLPHEEGSVCNKVQVAPKSPRTPTVSSRGMGHVIAHRFTKTFKVITVCNFCNRQMFGTGLKCKECKYKCHRECEPKVPPSCGLPQELVDEFKRSFQSDVFQPDTRQSPGQLRTATCSPNNGSGLLPPFRIKRNGTQQPPPTAISRAPDSSSNTSSCNSSTPSSPALLGVTLTPHSHARQQFHFPDVPAQDNETEAGSSPITDTALQVPTVRSQDELPTGERGGSTSCTSPPSSGGAQGDRVPVRVDSQDSQVSDGETGGVERDGSHRWPRQNSLSMREWDIPYDELKIGEQIGRGRFGTVYRGNWHGDVAIKVLNMDYLDDEKALETFRAEVGTFRKTRHENLMLFMGACMKPPRLAIVTSLSRGNTLYTHIHLRKDKFNVTRTTIIAQQVSQGMGYLHAKDIVHKDLKSKNIFLENGKVVIADFGLFSVTKLCYGNRKGDSLGIPPGWLCYLAPEIVRSLRAHQAHDEELPFSKASDVYAFGTVWYELLCGEWPFKGQPPESIIWQVGKGMKQPLANLQASRDVKDILMLCWSFRSADRPDFICLLNTLNKLPKKRLTRSPSHPIHLSRSAESVF